MIVIHGMVFFWCIAGISFLLLEIASPGLFFYSSFFFGCLGAAVGTFCFDSIIIQTAIMFIITIVTGFMLWRYTVPWLYKNRINQPTNVYVLYGQRGTVIKDIPLNEIGMVHINGEKWFACGLYGISIKEGLEVEVIDIKGAHLIVKEIF